MPTLDISLTPQLAAFVEDEIRAGRADSPSEVIGHALAAALRQRELHEAKLERLRAEIAVGLAQAEAADILETSAAEILSSVREHRASGHRS